MEVAHGLKTEHDDTQEQLRFSSLCPCHWFSRVLPSNSLPMRCAAFCCMHSKNRFTSATTLLYLALSVPGSVASVQCIASGLEPRRPAVHTDPSLRAGSSHCQYPSIHVQLGQLGLPGFFCCRAEDCSFAATRKDFSCWPFEPAARGRRTRLSD